MLFLDAPLDGLYPNADAKGLGESPYNTSNTGMASASLPRALGRVNPLTGRLTPAQLELMDEQVKQAESLGVRWRYWDTPSWPTGVRGGVWWEVLGRIFAEEGDAAAGVVGSEEDEGGESAAEEGGGVMGWKGWVNVDELGVFARWEWDLGLGDGRARGRGMRRVVDWCWLLGSLIGGGVCR